MKINEVFYSIQGEGLLIGLPTTFIRTTGCNLRCNWCDTTYAYEDGKLMTVDEIIREVKSYPTKHVCVTGGEPLIQSNINFLLRKVLEKGYYVSIETNGSLNIRNLPNTPRLIINLDIKCPSSGMHEKMFFSNIKWLDDTDQLKFVIADETDYEYAKEIIRRFSPRCNIIFQPVGGTGVKMIADNVLRDRLQVRVLPQLHKLIWPSREI